MTKIKEWFKKLPEKLAKHKAIAIVSVVGVLAVLYLFRRSSTSGTADTTTSAANTAPVYYQAAGVAAGGSGGSTTSTDGSSSTQSITDAINANTSQIQTIVQQLQQSNQNVIDNTGAALNSMQNAILTNGNANVTQGGSTYNTTLALLTQAKNAYYSATTDAGRAAAQAQGNQVRATAATSGINVSALESDAENAIVAQGGAAGASVAQAKATDPYISK